MTEGLPQGYKPRIAPLFRLQYEAAQEAWVLLYPEGMVKLNLSAAEILRRCDGQRTAPSIVAELEDVFAQSGLEPQVHIFLLQARSRGWLN